MVTATLLPSEVKPWAWEMEERRMEVLGVVMWLNGWMDASQWAGYRRFQQNSSLMWWAATNILRSPTSMIPTLRMLPAALGIVTTESSTPLFPSTPPWVVIPSQPRWQQRCAVAKPPIVWDEKHNLRFQPAGVELTAPCSPECPNRKTL